MKRFNEQHAEHAVKHGLTKAERKQHAEARKQRKQARGKRWEVIA